MFRYETYLNAYKLGMKGLKQATRLLHIPSAGNFKDMVILD
jgi:hypothetical protein